MPCPLCGGLTQAERSLEDQGWISVARAVHISGRSRSWVEARLSDGRLTSATRDGRPVVSLRALEGLMSIIGPPSPVEQARMLRESGEAKKPSGLRRRFKRQRTSGPVLSDRLKRWRASVDPRNVTSLRASEGLGPW